MSKALAKQIINANFIDYLKGQEVNPITYNSYKIYSIPDAAKGFLEGNNKKEYILHEIDKLMDNEADKSNEIKNISNLDIIIPVIAVSKKGYIRTTSISIIDVCSAPPHFMTDISQAKHEEPQAVEIDTKNLPKKIRNKLPTNKFVITNGDLNEQLQHHLNLDIDNLSTMIEEGDENLQYPTISFACLRRILEFKFTKQAIADFIKGNIKLLDYTSDKVINLTDTEMEKISDPNKKNPQPPEPGMTRIRHQGVWHRPAQVLLQQTTTLKDKKNQNHYYYLGQDEGTYFGVELPKRATSTTDAIEALKPKPVKNATNFKRQGEWFAVPVNKKDVPDITEVVATTTVIDLPVDHKDSNKHILGSKEMCTPSHLIVGKDHQIYARDAILEHPDHESLTLEENQWYTFYHNTALKSVSMEGVD